MKANIRRRDRVDSDGRSRGVELITQIAFILALALLVARATMGDFGRNRSESILSDAPRGAGPAAGMALDLLCCVPALLVLARRLSDRQYVLRTPWSCALLGGLAAWGGLSVCWSADRFGALVAAFHWVAAAAMVWAGAQLVRSWLRLRIVAAVMFGLLLAYAAHSLFFKFVDAPATRDYWEKHRVEILKERGIAEGTFQAGQFEKKVLAEELIGFFRSANSMAAVVVMLLVVALGLGIQRRIDDPDDATGIAILAIAAIAAGWMIFEAKSKTAAATPILAIALLAAGWRWRAMLAQHARRAFWIAVGVVVLGFAAAIGHGLYHHGLPGESLTFRWHYWVGATRIFAQHPLRGVGLDNFGEYYLGVRLPEAAEEVKDPHNFLVRFLCELGIIGIALAIAWVGRLAWEGTRPIVPKLPVTDDSTGRAPQTERLTGGYSGPRAILTLVAICVFALFINVIASLDFKSDAGYVLNELLQKLAIFALMLVGASIGAIKSFASPELDERPAPLVLFAILAALAVFLVHNLVDFSLFEPGALTAFAFVTGSALGVRQPSAAGRKRRTPVVAVSMALGVVAWMVAAGFVWIPTASAEDAAAEATRALRTNRPAEAMRLLGVARVDQPLNGDYAVHAAKLLIAGDPQDSRTILDLLDRAIRTDPMDLDAYLARARYLMRDPARSAEVTRDFARVLALNPNDASLRVEFADALASYKDRDGARRQYAEALRYDGMLKGNEPKRFSPERVAEIRGKIAELETPIPAGRSPAPPAPASAPSR